VEIVARCFFIIVVGKVMTMIRSWSRLINRKIVRYRRTMFKEYRL